MAGNEGSLNGPLDGPVKGVPQGAPLAGLPGPLHLAVTGQGALAPRTPGEGSMRQLLHTDELTGPPSPAASGQKIQADPDVIREVIKGFQDERNDIQVFIKQCEDLRQVHPPGEDGQSHGFLDPHHRLTPELRDYYIQVQQNYQAVIDNLQADLAGLQRTEDTNSRKFEGQL